MKLGSLQKRIVSGLIMAPITIAVILKGGFIFMGLMTLAILVSLHEWLNLVNGGPHRIALMLAGAVYLMVCYASYIFVRFGLEQGAWLALSVMLTVWACDIGAYAAGKTIGGPKMAPMLSPNKTWAGLGGSILSGGLGLLGLFFLGREVGYDTGLSASFAWAVFVAGCVMGVTAQAGDLMESYFKRRANVKDAGSLIPGHGGLLDRIDGLLLVAPVFMLMILAWQANT